MSVLIDWTTLECTENAQCVLGCVNTFKLVAVEFIMTE